MKKYEFEPAGCESPEDLIRLLLEYREVYNSDEQVIYTYDPTSGFTYNLNPKKTCVFAKFRGAWIKKEVEWYRKIPEHGVLCWIYSNKSNMRIGRVMHYKESDIPFATDTGAVWEHADPLTNEEIKQFLDPEDS